MPRLLIITQFLNIRTGKAISLTLIALLLLTLGACSNPFRSRSKQLGQRAAANPMQAVEAYLGTHQPGPAPRLFQTTRIYDRQGVLIAEFMDEGRRTWIGLDDVSPHLVNATIATEDASFFTNSGVDPVRIAGAAIQNMQEGAVVSGASTITMQLARNLFLGPERRTDQTVDRKVFEAGLAQELTDLYAKREILEMYLNMLNYGQLTYGPQAASQVYFGKAAADLTIAEATLLAGIPQQPANLNPYRNMDAAKERQQIVLALMVRHGYLSQAAADAAYATPLELAGEPGMAPNLAPHFSQYVIDTLDAEFGEGFTRRSGWNIHTTLDLELQGLAEGAVAQNVARLRTSHDLTNAALVAMQPGSAEILAMVGSADFTDDSISGQVNVALSRRQPGSAIKPILYATALDDNLVSPASLIWDTPISYTVSTDQIYRPLNYDRTFHGPVSLRTALANSYNVPAVKLLNDVGVETMLTRAKEIGLKSLDRDEEWYGLSVTLGGGEVTLLDLTTAFHTIADGGRYLPPGSIQHALDNLGNISYEPPPTLPVQILSPQAAFLVTDILSDNEAREPAFGSQSPLRLSRPAAVKTGTTSDWRDNWTIGYTRFIVTGVWAGNSDGHPMRDSSGITGAAPIWRDFMESVMASPSALVTLGAAAENTAWQFPAPEQIQRIESCPPDLTCRSGGEFFTSEWLQAAGDAGPLADSVVEAASVPVYVDTDQGAHLGGFCRLEEGLRRSILHLPAPFGLPATDVAGQSEEQQPDRGTDGTPAQAEPSQGESADGSIAMTLDRKQAMAWSLRYGSWADLGTCDELEASIEEVASLLQQGENRATRIVVDMAAADNAELAINRESGQIERWAVDRSISLTSFSSPGIYALNTSVIHDRSCPGQYVMGRVINLQGAPVAGIRIRARDEWGNSYETTSKNGGQDYGLFDFPIYSYSPHDIYVTVIDANGAPISQDVLIPHFKGSMADATCHHVVFQGG